MMKKGLILCFLTFLVSTLLLECVYYGDRLIVEFQETEKVETLPISEISTYNPNPTDGIYLGFRYRETKSGREYACYPLFTTDKSYQVGDPVEVVTRNGCPRSLLCNTKRKRQRTIAERAADVGYDCGMILHICITVVLLLLCCIPNRRMIPEEYKKRKKFVVINTAVYAIVSAAACVCWLAAVHNHTWDALAYGFFALLLYAGGAIGLLIAWIVNSVKLKKREMCRA